MATYFTADTHFGDSHILRQRGSRFATCAAHDEALVARWNTTVGPNDTVWHIGDFAAHADRAYCGEVFARLVGVKRLIRGNHDTNRVLDLPWAETCETAGLTLQDATGAEHRLFLSHYPHRSWPGIWRGTRHFHGHTHARLQDTRLSCDVGVDAWEFAPVSLEAAVARQDAASRLPEELELATRGLGVPQESC